METSELDPFSDDNRFPSLDMELLPATLLDPKTFFESTSDRIQLMISHSKEAAAFLYRYVPRTPGK